MRQYLWQSGLSDLMVPREKAKKAKKKKAKTSGKSKRTKKV